LARPVWILEDSKRARWELLELVLRAEDSGPETENWPEIILLGDAFHAETLAAARALGAAYPVHIRFAQSIGNSPKFHPGSGDAVAMARFFAQSGNGARRAFYIGIALRWSARARRTFAYVRQFGRFNEDEAFWRELLSDPGSVTASTGEHRIRFRLHTAEDYRRFEQALHELDAVVWTGTPGNGEDKE
jgi:hypothetical protein